MDTMIGTLQFLTSIFANVFFVPGNNELRLTKRDQDCQDSIEKFEKVLNACKKLGVNVQPKKVTASIMLNKRLVNYLEYTY